MEDEVLRRVDEFLKEIESWRDRIARNFALRNPSLSQRELNFAVQRTIGRVIFLRICEDRGIEDYGRLMALRNGAKSCGVPVTYRPRSYHIRPAIPCVMLRTEQHTNKRIV